MPDFKVGDKVRVKHPGFHTEWTIVEMRRLEARIRRYDGGVTYWIGYDGIELITEPTDEQLAAIDADEVHYCGAAVVETPLDCPDCGPYIRENHPEQVAYWQGFKRGKESK